MKVAILHHDIEPCEIKINKLFLKKGFKSKLFDIRFTNFEDLQEYDLVLNRVYANVITRSKIDNLRAIKLIKELENNGINCINSSKSNLAAYSKYYASELMNKALVRNPSTLFVNSKGDFLKAEDFILKFNFPLIFKRDIGGNALDVVKVNSLEELKFEFNKRFSHSYLQDYDSGHVIQEYLENVCGYDCRLAIIDGKYSFAFKRSLISTNKEENCWLASVSQGSEKNIYYPSEEEISLAIRATEAIGAKYNEVDLTFTKEGPAIIECNPVPNYYVGEDDLLMNKVVEDIGKIFNLENNEDLIKNEDLYEFK